MAAQSRTDFSKTKKDKSHYEICLSFLIKVRYLRKDLPLRNQFVFLAIRSHVFLDDVDGVGVKRVFLLVLQLVLDALQEL